MSINLNERVDREKKAYSHTPDEIFTLFFSVFHAYTHHSTSFILYRIGKGKKKLKNKNKTKKKTLHF